MLSRILGHWIQACPTNENPDWENKPRFKRTTGIPKMFLKTVEQPAAGEGGNAGVMITADGSFVMVQPDT
jgi:protein MPE1